MWAGQRSIHLRVSHCDAFSIVRGYQLPYAGCGLAKGTKENLAKSIKGSAAALRWMQTEVLVIDESMIPSSLR